jgi:hypothetical protein
MAVAKTAGIFHEDGILWDFKQLIFGAEENDRSSDGVHFSATVILNRRIFLF